MDPVRALEGGRIAVALRLAAADHVVANMPGPKPDPKYSDGMPES